MGSAETADISQTDRDHRKYFHPLLLEDPLQPTANNLVTRKKFKMLVPFYSVVAASLFLLFIVAGSIIVGLYYHHQASDLRVEYDRILKDLKKLNMTLGGINVNDSDGILIDNLTKENLQLKQSIERVVKENSEHIKRLQLELGLLRSHPEMLKSSVESISSENVDEGQGYHQSNGDSDKNIPPSKSEIDLARIRANMTNELFLAIDGRDDDEVKSLIDRGADVDGRSNKSETPLQIASSGRNKSDALKLIKILIENGADPTAKDSEDYTFLHKLVDAEGTTTALTPSQFHEIVEYLISQNLSSLFNDPGNFYKIFDTPRWSYLYRLSTPFQMAVKNLEIEPRTLRLLQQNGVNFNAINSNEDSVLFYALMGKRSPKFLNDLVSLGANWRHLNNYNSSLLHRSSVFGGVDELRFFLNLGLDIDALNSYGNTALHVAVSGNNGNVLEMVKFLIENGADVGIKDGYGNTALDMVKMRGNVIQKTKIIQLLEAAELK